MPALKKPLKEPHSSHSFLSDFILGSQDGLVNVLGILLGVAAATSDVRIIYVAALAALGAESISMGAVAYTSTVARRRQYMKEVSREQREMKDVPETELQEVRDIFKSWGYIGDDARIPDETDCFQSQSDVRIYDVLRVGNATGGGK